MTAGEIRKILSKPAFDEVQVSENIKNRLTEIFGKTMTPVQAVDCIVADIRAEGDAALFRYTEKIDGVALTAGTVEVSSLEWSVGAGKIDAQLRKSLEKAAENIRLFHEEEKPKDWQSARNSAAKLGQIHRPVDRAGVYIPGGTASYPSSVLMTAIPAVVAGVSEVIMAVPPPKNGEIDPVVLAAAEIAGVTRIFKIGGAQAIAAMAFGTASVPRVDTIVGPGNLFVTLAKKAVYGYCNIDMLAGPSEILIVADESADVRYLAADLLSQAEHDRLASSILITDSLALATMVADEAERQLAELPRREIATEAMINNGLIIVAPDLATAIEWANWSAPEHLEIMTRDPESLLPLVRHAGAIFLGAYSPEPLGDYWAGPSHVLPTGGTARFSSVLNVETFMKKMSVIQYSKQDLQLASEGIVLLANAEGLDAHARAISIRGRN